MLLRKIVLTAFVLAPLGWSPVTVSAQETGLDQAAAASASAQADVAAGVAKSSAGKRPTTHPSGVAKVFEGQTLPPGMDRAFPQSDTESEPEPEPEPDEGGDEGGAGVCIGGILWVDGIPTGTTCV